MAKVLHNLQVRVTNLHMRYEDATNCPDSPFAIGLTLKELSAFTTDAAGNRRFSTESDVQHKWVELRSLAVYHHTRCGDMCTGARLTRVDDLCAWLGGMIATPETAGAARVL